MMNKSPGSLILHFLLITTLIGCQLPQRGQDSTSTPVAVGKAGDFASLSAPDRSVLVQATGVAFGRDDIPQPPAKYEEIRIEKSILVPMRDGVRLATDLYFPVGASGPLPVILIRLPYNKNTLVGFRRSGSLGHFFAGQGYVVAVQDMRGRFESEGLYTVSRADRDDGYDSIEWLSNQAWSTGKIGTYGCSYLGENQIMQAATRHPNHFAAVPQAAGGSYGASNRPFGVIRGGVFELATGLGWFWSYGDKIFYRPPPGLSDTLRRSLSGGYQTLPNKPEIDFKEAFWHLPTVDILKHYGGPVTDYEDFLSHPPGDPYWATLNYVLNDDHFDVPALHVSSWFDGVPRETTLEFNLFRENAVSKRARDNQYMIMSPTAHCRSELMPDADNALVGELPVGDIRLDYMHIYVNWFDHWLKGEENGVLDMPKVQYYLMGANEWRSAETWPVPDTEFTKFYLHSDGGANSRLGSGMLDVHKPSHAEPFDRFTYDPGNPVPSVGGPICCISAEAAPAGSYDQSEVEMRHDVLVYTTPPLEYPLDVVGPIDVQLWVSSSARDTDFTVKLVDVYPDGTAYNIQEGILRARYREGYEKTVFMKEGEIYPLTVDLSVTANQFGQGHRIRIEVSSSNFPRSERNLNTGGNNYDETQWIVARNRIHHSNQYPSHILLPIVPSTR